MGSIGVIEASVTLHALTKVPSLRLLDSHELPCVRVRQMSPMLDFYIAVGCAVQRAADGWVQLRNADTRFILTHGRDLRSAPGSPVPDLASPDLMRLCRRLQALGVETGPISYPVSASGGQITVRDPDQHTVVITHVVDDISHVDPSHPGARSSTSGVRWTRIAVG
jgi:hypothetical protein